MPVPGPGEILVRARFLDVAPYMRARISPTSNYARGVRPGQLMIGGAVGEVVRSEAIGLEPGDLVVADIDFGWQEYALLRRGDIRLVDTDLAPPECWLDVMGLNGATAWLTLFTTGRLQPGDDVVVSAAAGSVGQIAGQLARLAGARPIAVTSTPEKLLHCLAMGYADGIAWRDEPDLATAVRRLCPSGVDVFLDNTAGPIHDAVLQNLAASARIVLNGTAALAATFGEPDIGPRFLRHILVARARLEGFLVLDHGLCWSMAWDRLGRLLRQGVLRTRYDIVDGFERLPEALIGLLRGESVGKRLVRVG